MSAFLRVELTRRSVDTRRSFFAFMASFKALLMSSRSMVTSLAVCDRYRFGDEAAKAVPGSCFVTLRRCSLSPLAAPLFGERLTAGPSQRNASEGERLGALTAAAGIAI